MSTTVYNSNQLDLKYGNHKLEFILIEDSINCELTIRCGNCYSYECVILNGNIPTQNYTVPPSYISSNSLYDLNIYKLFKLLMTSFQSIFPETCEESINLRECRDIMEK